MDGMTAGDEDAGPPTQPEQWAEQDRKLMSILGTDPLRAKAGAFPWKPKVERSRFGPCWNCGGRWFYGVGVMREAGAIFRCLHCGELTRIR